MENVVLTVHLILALLLIGVVLLQRSEGGGLGMGGGGGGGNVMTGRQAANALSKGTWIIAGAFLVTSIALTVIAAKNSAGGSVVDRIAPLGSSAPATNLPSLPSYTPPPGVGQPVLPPGAAPVAGTTAEPVTAPVTAPPAAEVSPPLAAAPAPAAPETATPAPAAAISPAEAPAAPEAEAVVPAETSDNVTTQSAPVTPAPAN